ncbi:ornithine cyclodeaminase family protein [Streptomyces sp. SCA3-4]|uniref:ornithine cyclodeaminase family protein n=1 Tax=Streptomyces sichuanensis TaxID=2871810 RepID=UPI001CE2B37C|nr:ornithine cyclodeaminase family protein [Streptomyces sichuanensis]MCA6095627.1 ornithine cyclodeaminase family protein [Streptomyces sichuanensis]
MTSHIPARPTPGTATGRTVSTPPEGLLFLDRAAVRACAGSIDPVEAVESVLRAHAAGRTELPPEGYLPWANSQGAYCRSLAMLGAVGGPDGTAYGMKLINAATSNPAQGRDRAGGCGFLFDPETARPVVLAEAAYLSALRTAAYTMSSLRHLGPPAFDEVTLIGCGAQARTHAELLARYFPAVRALHVHDLLPERTAAFADWVGERGLPFTVTAHEHAERAAAASPVVITVTVSDTGYLGAAALRPGSFVAHVSLDDLLPEVFDRAEAVYVDDVTLVRENPRRVLGRLMAEGRVLPPGAGERTDGATVVRGTLGDVLTGAVPARRPERGVVVSNPFGMAVLDVGLLARVFARATADGLGTRIDLLGEDR